MLVSTFRMEDDQTPYVFSMPPHIDSEGDEVAAYVSVRPSGRTAVTLPSTCQSMRRRTWEVVPGLVELEVAVPRLRPAVW